MIDRSTDIKAALRSRQRGFLLNPFRFGGVPPSVDPHWSSVILLLKMDGVVGSTAFADSSPVGASVSVGTGGLQRISSDWSVAGQSCEFFSGGGHLFLTAGSGVMALGTGDLTVEGTLKVGTLSSTAFAFMDFRPPGVNGAYPSLFLDNTKFWLTVNNARRIEGNHGMSSGSVAHVAWSRVSGSSRLFVSGLQIGPTWADSTNYLAPSTGRPVIGASGFDFGLGRYLGYMDEIRITKGIGRYSANFSPPTGPFPTTGP